MLEMERNKNGEMFCILELYFTDYNVQLFIGHRKEVLFGNKYAAKASKRTNSGAQSLEMVGGGPARPLRRSSLEGRFGCSEAVRV
ncbi:hypothetical protein PIB30_079954 [Stylosanthes scabra]|uniref:Uncharacterized protein n=1 Tax=Stylosanthes scabra TaxID=79078 RepID=A0ABU6WUP3_9FABA|nr:hypothetical protein [Stylosanthes scabra]